MQAHPDSWRYTCIVVNCVLVGAVGLFLAAALLTRRDADPDEGGGAYNPNAVEHVGALGVPVHPHLHPHPPPPAPPGGVSGDATLCPRDASGRLVAVEEGGSSIGSPSAGPASLQGSRQLLAETSGSEV